MVTRLVAVFAIMLIGIAGVSTAAAAAGQELNTNRPGGDYSSFKMPRPIASACADTCAGDPKCISWTYVKPGIQGRLARCWLKGSVPAAVPDACCVSGVTRLMQFPGKVK